MLKKGNEHVHFFNRSDTPEDPLVEADSADGIISKLKFALGNGGQSNEADTVSERLTDSGFANISPASEEFDQLCRNFLRAEIESWRILQAKLRGEYEEANPRDPLFSGIATDELPVIEGEFDASVDDISKATSRFIELKSEHEWAPKTQLDYKRVLRWFADYVGANRKLGSVTKDDISGFQKALFLVPSGFEKMPAYRQQGFKFASENGGDLKKFSPKSVSKYFDMLKTFMLWAYQDDIIATNPAGKIKTVIKKKAANSPRRSFTEEELSFYFRSPQYTGHKSISYRTKPGNLIKRDWKFWVPLIALFSGMRLGEICQTYSNDIIEKGGVTFLDLSVKHGQKKAHKSEAAPREIPVHDELKKIGFLDFVTKQQKGGPRARLFPDIKPGSLGDFSRNPSQYFGRYRKGIGLTDPDIVFHSFRHNFRDALREAEIPLEISHALMGHADGSVHASYGSGPSLKALNSAISKVSYNLNLSHLYTN